MRLRAEYLDEIRFIRDCVRQSLENSGSDASLSYLRDHFEYDLPAMRSILTANSIANAIPDNPVDVLDWGCGYGDIAYLVNKRRPNARIVCYDVRADPAWQVLVSRAGLEYRTGSQPVALPFPDHSFDYVLAVGVVEHVPDDRASVSELYRVLKPGGRLLMFLAPNKWSYTEFAMRALKRPAHDRLYSRRSLRELVECGGFGVESVTYEYALPIMLTSLPSETKRVYSWLGNLVLGLNAAISRVPLLSAVSSNLRLIAIKPVGLPVGENLEQVLDG